MPIMSTLGFRSVVGNPLQFREVWWHIGDDPNAMSNLWQAPVVGNKSVLQMRQAFLSSSAELHYLKCTFFAPGQPKNTVVRRLFPTLRGTAGPSDYLGVSVSISLQIPGHRRSTSIRGVPDDWVADNTLTDAGNAGIKKILGGITQANGKLLSKSVGYYAAIQQFLSGGIYIGTAADRFTIKSAANNAQGLVVLTVDDLFPPIVNVGQQVIVTATPTMPLLQSVWTVADKSEDPATITLKGSGQFRAVPGTTGVIRIGSKAVDDRAWLANVVGARTRDTGRPTDGPRGRRSARIRHR